MRRAALIAFSLIVASVVLSGCSRTESPEPAAEPQAPAATIAAMSFDQKQALIATSFPMEVPVPEGNIARGEAQGEDAWDYELTVAAGLGEVEDWYRQAYGSRNWKLTDRAQGDGSVSLTFVKAAAQSRVDLAENDGSTTALVILGVGAPVLQTQ